MSLTLVTPPAVEPLTEQDLLEHVRELDVSQAAYLAELGAVARQHVEDYCRRALCTQTWRLQLDRFPADQSFLRMPRPPLQSVTSVQYVDLSGALVTWGAANYVVDPDSLPGRLHLAYGVSWPSTRGQANAVRVTYVAGYGDAGDALPEALRHALKLLVGAWYEHREPLVTGTIATTLPFSVQSLLGPYRVVEY